MRFLAVVVALLGLTTGCSMLPGAKEPATAAAESDPWAGFNNGYAKNDKPAETKAETKAEEKTSKTETTSAELKTEKSDKSDKADKSEAKSDSADDEDDAKPVKKKPAKKKAAKKKPAGGATVATKKPRKRAKKS